MHDPYKRSTFPVLKPNEIVNCMQGLQIPFQLEDLTKPQNQTRIIQMYENLALLLNGYIYDSSGPLNFSIIEILEHPDLHVDALGLMGLFKQLYKMLKEIGMDDFSLVDLIKPDPKRLRVILSSIINFAKFREDRLAIFETCTRKGDEAHELKSQLTEKNAILAEKVNSIRLHRAEQEPQVQELRALNSTLASDLKELRRLQQAISSDIEQFKKEKLDLDDKLKNINFSVANTKQECERLQSRIVKNPDALKAAIRDMNDNVNSHKLHITELEKKARSHQLRMDIMNSVEQDIQSAIKILQECEVEKKKLESFKITTSSSKDILESRQSEYRELTIKEQQGKRQLQLCSDKISRLQTVHCTKQKNLTDKLEHLRKEYATLSSEREVMMEKVDANNRIMSEMDEKIAEAKKQMETEEFNIQKDIRGLIEHMETYMENLGKSFRVRDVSVDDGYGLDAF